MTPPRQHVFVCQNRRPSGGRPSCNGGGVGAAVLRALQEQTLSLGGEVAVTACHCLGPCFNGPVVVVYPQGIWYGGVAPTDVQEIVRDHLRDGRPVARLRLPISPADE